MDMAIEVIRYKDPPLEAWPHDGRVVVFDLEYTAWEGSWQRGWGEPWEHREVVQIGAVMVDATSGFLALKSLSRFVRPERNPQLSEYFVQLTGISQVTVDCEGWRFADAYGELVAFAEGADALLCNGLDGEVLRENCFLHGIEDRFKRGRVANIRQALAKAVSSTLDSPRSSVDSGDLLKVLGVAVPAGMAKHDALSDARGIVAAMAELRSRHII